MKILLLGKNGQIGRELRHALPALGEVVSLGREDIDLRDQDALRITLSSHQPDVIVNAAGYTAVDLAESHQNEAALLNTQAVTTLAHYAQDSGTLLVHYSTDYVFDGASTAAYTEADAPAPKNVYGATKLAGEAAIRAALCDALILRCSWVYAADGQNFPRTILRLARTRDQLDVVVDQVGAPTSAALIADVTLRAITARQRSLLASGIYHLSASGVTSWYAYARYLVAGAAARRIPLRLTPDGIRPITSADYNAAARRPHNSRLDSTLLATALGLQLADWTHGVEQILDQLSERAHHGGDLP
ncbi:MULTISPECIES: dTDP-4-dehydrorhamnose reductase [Achromobacter]|uniref:dTDP-4-dehydrorhamnose reductase n=1 Tax=Achromobacter spanius TaxID=217203 RepID=A0ABY8GNT8_9BURK|nr:MULTISPECIES: dTDP-4-dehydrorhamnose reductase [Achromobacter]WAI84386.1 dTDP-4-dehydrorhamnose reductase [Achromobacter spanius]WEX94469.1 dTDP-4-dehydrorhamnose reductase [Achromobacter sp. SS2-2022]WFP06367.1 dTDP-4-dehydrorhamnose reductase [Achromobacter spanius]